MSEPTHSAENDALCLGDGGTIFWHDGYGLFGGQWIETPCEACGGWHNRARVLPPGSPQP